MNEALRVAIVGCGLIGRKRAGAMPGGQLVACADPDVRRATELASTVPGAEAFTDWREMLTKTPCDIVVVATPHHMLAEITAAAIEQGCHVLVEKPAARFAVEIEPLCDLARIRGVVVRVGFNHRCHRGIAQGLRARTGGRFGRADVPARPLWTRRPHRLRSRVARRSQLVRRRRVDRSGRPSHRSRPLVPRRFRHGCRALLTPTTGTCLSTTTPS